MVLNRLVYSVEWPTVILFFRDGPFQLRSATVFLGVWQAKASKHSLATAGMKKLQCLYYKLLHHIIFIYIVPSHVTQVETFH